VRDIGVWNLPDLIAGKMMYIYYGVGIAGFECKMFGIGRV
jgi:hypothetical protein